VIDWANAKVIDRESDKAGTGRLIREAIWIRKTDNMNRDEGSYQLSHVWKKLLHTEDRHRKSVLMIDEGFRREAETSINSMLFLVVI